MVIRVFSVYFFCSIFPLLSGALRLAHQARERLTAKDQTISQVRSQEAHNLGSRLTDIREGKPAHKARN